MIYVVDNFFENPDKIRKYAMSVNYNTPDENDGWRGFRSNELTINNSIEKEVIEKIKNELFEISGKIYNLLVYFHCSPRFIMDQVQNFHQYKYHEDNCEYAGIVYLTPNPPKNSGTCIVGAKCIENLYNRLLTYSGYLTHGPDHLFGEDLETTRLTVTFFAHSKCGKSIS